MLMLFPSIKVPGLEDIEIFRDHQKHDQFYALRSIPSVARDKDGKPALSFMFFERNADIAYASSPNKELIEAQLGQLLVTVDLSVSPEEHKIISDYLRDQVLNNHQLPFVRLYHRITKRTIPETKIEPKLAYPDTWKEGTARLEILEGLGDTFKKSSSAEVKPSLVGSNSAAFYATFGIEGAQIYYDALTKGYKDEEGEEEKTPLQAIVRYDLKGFAFVPNLEVKVTGRASQMYDFIQERTVDYQKEIEQGKRTTTKKFLGITYSKKTTTYDKKIDISKSDITTLTEEMIDRKIINIEITDFGDVAANSEEKKEVEENLRNTLIDTIMNTIVASFFQTAFIGQEDTGSSTEGTTTQPQADPTLPLNWNEQFIKNQHLYYHFKNEIDKTKITDIYFHFKKNGTVEFNRYPNGTLATQLTESERKALVRHIDISSPEVQILEVQVKVNADFAADNIHSIIVNLNYSQKDFKSGVVRENAKSFLFETGTEVYTFRVTMARNEKGELLDFYNATAKISYKGTAEAPPPIELKEYSDRALVISYDKLGFITVNASAGDIDWSTIREAVVDLEYRAEPDKPDTRKQIRLSEAAPTGNWKCFMYGHKEKQYRYKVKYFYTDGTESETEFKEDTRDTLIIDDNLTGRIKASFDVIMDANTVTSAKIEILYQDASQQIAEEYSKWFTASETWDWNMRLRENATNRFKYRYFVQYTDGLVKTSDWMEAGSDEDIPPVDIKRYERALTIDGGLLDWTKWKMVYVNVKYADEANLYVKSEMLRFDQSTPMQSFRVLAFQPDANHYSYSLKFASNEGIVDVPETSLDSGVLILEEPTVNA